ncbi:MAG: DNA polymerase III subunit delta [Patescibacteria group bacterium]|jgi:DNA polymerase-3 subunit delta
MIIFIHGTDTFRVHERVLALQAAFRKKFKQASCQLNQFEAKQLTEETLRKILLTPGLFAIKRFVLIKNVLALPNKLEALFCTTLQRSNPDTIIVCTAEQLPKTVTPLTKLLLASKTIEAYSLLKPVELNTWIKKRCALQQVTITPDAIIFLTQSLGNDLWLLHNTIVQLTHYTKTITLETVRLFVLSPLDENIFHFTDALAERNTAKALRLLHEQLSGDVNIFYLLTMMARQISLLIQVKEPTSDTKTIHPFVLKKTQQHAQHFSLTTLLNLHKDITTIDAQLKSQPVSSKLLLDRFVIRCTTL